MIQTDTKEKIHYRTCPLCEATCGLEIYTKEDKVVKIRGDECDPLSHGYLCPKGSSLNALHEDPDRLRKPMLRKGDNWTEVSWQEAFKEVKLGFQYILEKYSRKSVGVYLGNPNVHNLAGLLYLPAFLKALGSRQIYSASTLDQIPKQLVAEMLYGNDFSIPIPDIDRTDYLIIIGGNPLVSNGSMMTAPNMRERIKNLKQRGGKLVVIDPAVTETAKLAQAHYQITPGKDAIFLLSVIYTLFENDLINLGRLQPYIDQIDKLKDLVKAFPPENVAKLCNIDVDSIRLLTHELATAKRAIVYGRMGTCTQEYGTLTSWSIDIINILTGNLDKEGGVMFPLPAAGGKNISNRLLKRVRLGRYKSRVRGLKEILGELPTSTLAEEIQTPGDEQIKALVTIAGNPVLTSPNGKKLSESISNNIEFMVSVDAYLNETTQYANVILPIPSPLERSHYDLSFYHLSVRNVSHYSRAIFPMSNDQLDEWETLLSLTSIVNSQPIGDHPIETLDELMLNQLIKSEVTRDGSPVYGRDIPELKGMLTGNRGPERLLDFLLRSGPYGDHFGRHLNGLSLNRLEENPHGLDLGPLQPRLPEILKTSTRKIEWLHNIIIEEINRLQSHMDQEIPPLLLIGRRNLLSNNSWMHNLAPLMKGKDKCTLYIHPHDAHRLGLVDQDIVKISSNSGNVIAPLVITEAIMQGVVSLPHGWGHHFSSTKLHVACQQPGVSFNDLTDNQRVDCISGNAVFNGIPVTIEKYKEYEQ